MSNQAFNFKQFKVEQDKCAMKIGTDAVLLGAWSSLKNSPFSILDIGSGTGVLSLMLAQRSASEIIDALEIDEYAYEQCVENFENSPWSDRLFCYHASLEEFVEEIDDNYDLIISNPPFYSEDYKSKTPQRDLARFEDALPFEHLIESVIKLLAPNGTFNVIIPFNIEQEFINLAEASNLFPNKILRVKGTSITEIKRSLIEFSFIKSELKVENLTIEISRHNYTEEYISLTKDFYLKM